MKRGDTVVTFTGRTGRIVELLPGARVAVSLVLYPGKAQRHPIRADVIYDRADVQTTERI